MDGKERFLALRHEAVNMIYDRDGHTRVIIIAHRIIGGLWDSSNMFHIIWPYVNDWIEWLRNLINLYWGESNES